MYATLDLVVLGQIMSTIIRLPDGAVIPDDPRNRDYRQYLAWVEAGGVPESWVPPEDGGDS